MEKLKSLVEWNVYGVCTAIGLKLGISTSRIRQYFLYTSVLTLGSPEIDCLIPIPVRKITERTRGYNQSLLLCEGIAQVFPIPILPTVLFKNKKTNTQTRKDRIERGHNTTLLFGLKNTDQIYNKHLLLVDDIITTGATAESAGRCLLQAKPASIQFAAAAYTLS